MPGSARTLSGGGCPAAARQRSTIAGDAMTDGKKLRRRRGRGAAVRYGSHCRMIWGRPIGPGRAVTPGGAGTHSPWHGGGGGMPRRGRADRVTESFRQFNPGGPRRAAAAPPPEPHCRRHCRTAPRGRPSDSRRPGADRLIRRRRAPLRTSVPCPIVVTEPAVGTTESGSDGRPG